MFRSTVSYKSTQTFLSHSLWDKSGNNITNTLSMSKEFLMQLMKVKYSCSIDAILLPSRTIDIKSHSILRVPPILRMWESFSYGLWIFLLSVILIAIEFVYFGQYLKIKCYYLISLLFIVKFYYVIMNWEVRLDLWLTRDFSGSWWWSWWWHEALQALNWFLHAFFSPRSSLQAASSSYPSSSSLLVSNGPPYIHESAH